MNLAQKYLEETGEGTHIKMTDYNGTNWDVPTNGYVEWLEKKASQLEPPVSRATCGNCIDCKHYELIEQIDEFDKPYNFAWCNKLAFCQEYCGNWNCENTGCNNYESKLSG